MNLLFSCIGKRGYIARLFREHLADGDRIIGTSNTPWTSGFNACDKAYLMPDLGSPEYIPAVLELCKRERIDGLLSFFDMDVHRLSAHVDEFNAIGVKCFIPSFTIADICFDKWKTFQFLREKGFDTADTYLALADVRTALDAGKLEFPVYVKPRSGFGSRNTFKARNWKELEVFFGLEPNMIVQEALGGDAYDFDILNDLNGKVLSVVCWQKSLSRMGETEQATTVRDPLLTDLGVRLATALGHAGPLDADLFLWNGRVYVLEINLRFGGGYPVSHLAGAGFPKAIVELVNGRQPSIAMGGYEPGVVMMKELHIMGGPSERFFAQQLHVDASLRPVAERLS
ncbi:MAG TPA: ATP-grasp domain-containing protein [Flavobacteriales bacterium]|nr:ATP-grasp domain-containing protein [Flavobacteriales bacterium]